MNISLLIGSGFSFAAGIKMVPEINSFIPELEVDNLFFHTNGESLFFDDPKENTNKHMRMTEKVFFVDFISFYIEEILQGRSKFHYESFYDFFKNFRTNSSWSKKVNSFYSRFKKDNNDLTPPSLEQAIFDFERSFEQIVGHLLRKFELYDDSSLGNYPKYDHFLRFLEFLIKEKNAKIDVHTLNHDLLFESLCSRWSNISGYFSDGFSDLGSKYFGKVKKTFKSDNDSINKFYDVRVKRFTGKFNKPLCLYKLHGSIDTYIPNIKRKYNINRVKLDYGVNELRKEVYDGKIGGFKYEKLIKEYFPDFLSGSLFKISRYSEPYYDFLFNKFNENLSKAEYLIVIGYGFADKEVNNRLLNHYLKPNSKKLVVVDKDKPSCDLLRKLGPIEYLVNTEDGFEGVHFDEYKASISL
jgi:hypothetical protein